MADYVAAVHRAYLEVAKTHPPAVRARMPLLQGPFTVVAAGVQNLHVIATREPLPAPVGPEVEIGATFDVLQWTVRFYDPVVLPELGLIDEGAAGAGVRVRRALGLATHLYHLVVRPGAELGSHHAGHAGAGLANAHVAAARDFEAIRAHARGREGLVDEMEGAARAGLVRAQALLAREIVPWDAAVAALAAEGRPDPNALRRALLAAVRGDGVRSGR